MYTIIVKLDNKAANTVEHLTQKFFTNNDENRELAKNLLAPSWNSEEVDTLFNTAHSVSILGGELVEAAF
jgi:hypothetical protein